MQRNYSPISDKNPEYWVTDKQGRRLPYFDEVLFVFGSGRGSDAMLFVNGKSDAYEILRPELLDAFQEAATNAHSANQYRVNGVVSNMPVFRKAFSCKAEAPMVRQTVCRVW